MKKLLLIIGVLFLVAVTIPLGLEAEPAQNASVTITWTDGKHNYEKNTLTGINGYYEFSLPVGNANISAEYSKQRGNEYITVSNSTGYFVVDGTEWKNITLPASPEDTVLIKGHVYDNKTGMPIANANVSATFHNDFFYGFNFTFSDENGYYELWVPASNITIGAVAGGYYYDVKMLGTVGAGETRNVDLCLEPLVGIVKGYIKDKDTALPIKNAYVMIFGRNTSFGNVTFSNDSGYYEFRVIEGNMSVMVEASDYFDAIIPPFYVGVGETKWVNITMTHFVDDNAWVVGRVLDKNNQPISNANVSVVGSITLFGKIGDFVREGKTDAIGHYNISVPAYALPYGMTTIYSVVAEKEGYFANSTSGTIQIFPGETKYMDDIYLEQKPPENCVVKGYVYIKSVPTKKIHYVGGTGSGNYTTIQEAINAASDGDIIKVYPGTYDGPIVINKEIKLIGDPVIDGHGDYGIKIEANNTLVENFTVFNCSYGIYARNLSFTLHNITIRNCTVYDCENYGIWMHYANDVFVENNTIYNVSMAGIVIWYANGGGIKNNEIFDSGNALPISGCSNLVISGNKIHDNSGDGIKITGNSIHNKIIANHVYNNTGYYGGIYVYTSHYNEITDNHIYNNTKYGIYIDGSHDNTISHNYVYKNGYDGIYLTQDGNNNSISSNPVYNNSRYGIIVYGSNNTINNNSIHHNQNGIVIKDTATNNNITLNKMENNSICGIYLIGDSNTVKSNSMIYNGYGIHILGSNNTILSNEIANCNRGVYVGETAKNNEIKDNNIQDSSSYEMRIYGQNNIFTNNTINSTKFSFTYGGNLTIKDASMPALPPPHWQSIGKFLKIEKLDSKPAWMNIRIYYDDSDVVGLYEFTLKIWKYAGSWQEDGWNGTRYLDMINNIVGVNITSFSIFAPLAMTPNHLPYATNPIPANGSTDVSTNPTLSVVVHDEDGDTLNVSFYDASSDTLIGYVDGVLPGNTASIVWSGLSQGTTYYWYVILNDSYEENKSDVWHFTTTLPKPTVVYVDDDYDSSTSGWGYDHFANITDGINGVASGGIVYVYEGVYEESIGINKKVSIISLNGTANTIIKASGQNAVTMNYPCLLDGFTIRDAHADYDNVRGIWVKADGCIIKNVTITNITAIQNESKVIYTYGIMINYADNCIIENVTIYDIEGNDSTAYGIYVHESDNDSFKNITIFNITSVSTAYGMYISYGENSELVGINIDNVDGSSSYGIRTGYADNNILRWINVMESKYGIALDSYSDYNIIENCVVANNTLYGIIIGRATYNIIKNNNVHDNRYGITLWIDCYNNTIENNTIFSNDYYGVYFYSENMLNIIKGNVIYNNQYGIYLNELAGNNTILSNYIYNNAVDGMRIYSGYNNISFNHVYNNSKYGILISSGESNTVYANYIHDNGEDGIRISSYSSNNTIISNNIYNNSDDGIKLYYYTDGNIIKNNYIYNNSDGIEISYKNHTNNVIRGNFIYNNRYNGIFSDAIAINNTFMDNEIYDNGNNGIYIKSGGKFNSILNCDIYSNGYYGIRLENSINNTISDCNIYLNGDDGILIYSNSNNNSISNCNIYSNNDFGIWISTSSNYNNISGCNIHSNKNTGVGMGFSSIHNVIYDCNIYDNGGDGVYISSSNNVISGCNISNNYRGINIQASSNEIKSNYITENQYGIYIGSVNNNIIYNNYFNNTINAYDEGNNIWNISKTAGTNIIGGAWLGGNYWHDYAGNDTDGDDLGDTMLPYNCSGNIANGGDWHPLLVPTNHPPAVPYNPTPSDGATDVELDVTLQWQCYDPDGDALSYDIYFGLSSSSLEKKAGNITSASYPISNLQYSTTYYWRVVAWDEYGAKSIGPVWSFTTKEDTPPTVSNPHPANGSTGIAINPILAVDVDDADGDMLTVTFYDASDDSVIGMVENASPGSTVSIVWQGLQYSTTYSWYVIVSDGIKSTKSPTWTFTTKAKPQYTLTVSVNPEGAGIISMNPAGGVYEEGTIVTLTAIANEGYVFAYWSGDASGTNPTIQIIMNSNKNIIANFQLPNTPPQIEITEPENGTVVSGVLMIQGKAWDMDGNDTLQKVEIRIDGGEWKEAEGTTLWSYSWDTTKVANGWHTIEARAYDGIDYSNIAKITVNVQNVENNPPEIEITEPMNGSVVKGSIVVKGKAWDKDGNESLVKVEIRIDGGEWKEATGTINWAYTLDTTKLSNGWHTIEIRAYDGIDYSNIATTKINVQNEKEEKGMPWLIIGVVIVIIAIVAIAVLYLRKK